MNFVCPCTSYINLTFFVSADCCTSLFKDSDGQPKPLASHTKAHQDPITYMDFIVDRYCAYIIWASKISLPFTNIMYIIMCFYCIKFLASLFSLHK